MLSDALESHYFLLSHSTVALASHIAIILTFTLQPPPSLQDCPYHSLPLTSEISCGDTDGGKATAPVVLRAPESEVTRTYESIADGVVSEILKLTLGAQMLPAVSYVREYVGLCLCLMFRAMVVDSSVRSTA